MRVLVVLLSASAFGPYLAGGARTGQAAVYGLLLFLSPFALRRLGRTTAVPVIVAWLALVGVTAMWSPPNTSIYGSGSALANLDNLALPLSVVLVVTAMVTPENRISLLRRVAVVIVVGMCVNAVIGLMQLRGLEVGWLSDFWSGGPSVSTSERATTLGRFAGLVGVPVIAGILYSLALLSAIYLLARRGVLLAAVCGLLAIGGILTVSKVFLLIGLPVACWQLMRVSTHVGRRVVAVAGAVAAVYLVSVLGYLDDWGGTRMLNRLLPDDGALQMSVYLGGRYGDGSSTSRVLDAVWSNHPLFGFGLSGLSVATDTAWVQAIVLAGAVGAVALAALLVLLVAGFRHRRSAMAIAERRYLGGVVFIAVAGCFATPALTANRLAVLLWVLLALMLSYPVTGRGVPRRDAAQVLVGRPGGSSHGTGAARRPAIRATADPHGSTHGAVAEPDRLRLGSTRPISHGLGGRISEDNIASGGAGGLGKN